MRPANEIVGKILLRLTAALGEPFGRDKAMMAQMAIEWTDVLFGLKPELIGEAVSEWLRKQSKWPRPADIRNLCLEHVRPLEQGRHRGDMPKRKSDAERAGMARIQEIRKRYEHSATPFSDTFNDPDYQQYLADYTARTGLAPG